MTTLFPSGWLDYELLSLNQDQRREQFGQYTLVRPSQQPNLAAAVPENWSIHWQNPQHPSLRLTALLRPSAGQQVGVFPEQAAHWLWLQEQILQRSTQRTETTGMSAPFEVLNLFAYTGLASLACAQAGAKVTHVDAAHAAIGWAKQNQLASEVNPTTVRWILDDVVKFVGREVRREHQYDGLILDPPAFGHGPHGERWQFKRDIEPLLAACRQVLSPQAQFVVLNSYAVHLSPEAVAKLLERMMAGMPGSIECGELALETRSHQRLSTGVFARWEKRQS